MGAIAVIAVVGVVAGGAAWGLWSFNSINRVDLDLATTEKTEPQNFLVVGSDSRADIEEGDAGAGGMLGDDAPTGQRADSLMIARIDPDSDRVDLLSVPRDLWVPIADTGKEQRIDTAYSQSAQAVVDTVQAALDIPIHHFVEVDFRGFESLVDSLGGVPMYFDHPVRDGNSGLYVKNKGCVVLDGPQGLAFARSRHLQWNDGDSWRNDPTGDLGRMTRQQILTRSALAKAQDLGINDVGRMKALVDAGIGSVSMDATLGAGDLMALGERVAELDPDRMQTHPLPVVEHETDAGASVVLLDDAAAAPILDIFRGVADTTSVTTTTEAPPSADDITIDVYNGTGVEGEARRISFVMSSQGDFIAGAVEPADGDTPVTTVAYPKGSKAMGELVASWLTPAATLEVDEDLAPATVKVVLGDDFAGVDEPVATTVPAPESSTTSGSVQVTTTTVPQPGWTPGQPPQGVTCR